jgi:hypothetical protein
LALERNRKAYDLMTKEIIKLIYHVDKVKIQNILYKEIPIKIRIEELV